MVIRYRNLFRYRYVFGILFLGLLVLFFRHLVDYVLFPGRYLAAFIPGLRPDHFFFRLTGIEFLIIDITLASFLLVVVFILLSYWYDWKTTQQKARIKQVENDVIPIIIGSIYNDLLFVPETARTEILELKKRLRNKSVQEVFYKTLVHFQYLIDDDLSERLSGLVDETKIRKRIGHYLHSVKDSDVILGLRSAKTLKATEYKREVIHYSQTGNEAVRLEAVLCWLHMELSENPEEVIDCLEHLSYLDINQLLPEIKRSIKQPERICLFLESDRIRIRVLGLMVLKTMGFVGCKADILPMLDSDHPHLRKAAWDYFTSVSTEKDVWFLTAHFQSESPWIKSLVLKAIGRMNPGEIGFRFLERVVREEEAPLKVAALEILFDKKMEEFVQFMGTSDPVVEQAYLEVLNYNNP